MTMMTASGMIWLSSYCSRWWEKPRKARLAFGSPPAPNQVTPKPGQISTIVASRHKTVGRIEQIHAPTMPERHTVGAMDVGARVPELDQRGQDEQVRDRRGGDRQREHGGKVLGRIAAGDLEGHDHERGRHQAGEQVHPDRSPEPGGEPAEDAGTGAVDACHRLVPVRA